MRARYAPLFALIVAMIVPAACSSSSGPPPHPATTVDCPLPPVSSVTGPPCPGLCIESLPCGGAAPIGCPAGFADLGSYGCSTAAHCCLLSADGGPDATQDATGEGPDAADAHD